MKREKTTELTALSVVLGVILAIVFGGANAYLGLRVGMTVSASIPAAVISMGILRMLLRKESVLENNMVQTIGSAGESLAAGAIFTMPVLFMWAKEYGKPAPSLLEIALIAVCGGIIGVLFMVPLRRALIVKEDGKLPYPEGKACAEVLLAGGEKSRAGIVFKGMGISALYKFLADGIKMFPSEVDYAGKYYKGSGIGIDVLPALVGVGYICGARVSSYLLAGGSLAWLVLMPLIVLFGGDNLLHPSDVIISEMATGDIWESYIRYLGAGAVAAGGVFSLIKALPLIGKTFMITINDLRNATKDNAAEAKDKDLPIGIVGGGIIILSIFMWLIPSVPVNLFGAILILIFGFFFATVSSRMVGLVGSSNNPVSGMAIATLLLATVLLKTVGTTGYAGMTAAISIGSVICIISCMAGDTSQDLKTGYIVGAAPIKQQAGELIGVVFSAVTIGGVLYLLDRAWGFGSAQLPAPQATLMKMVVEGVMEGNLPWTLVAAGAAIAVVVEILGIPVLPFAVGLYLPIHLSTPIMAGGLLRKFMEHKKSADNGVLYASGMIAGEGLVGIALAICAIIRYKGKSIGEWLEGQEFFKGGSTMALLAFALLCASLLWFAKDRKKKDSAQDAAQKRG